MPSLPPAIELVRHASGEGQLVLGLHDIGRNGASMARALRSLDRDHRVVTPDQRGHGASPTPHGPWSIDDFASDAARLVTSEGGSAIVVGTGLGAATALALTLGHPTLVAGLVLSGIGPSAEDADGQDRWIRFARALREQGGAEGVALAAEAMGGRPDWRGALSQVSVPALVLAGEHDHAAPPEVQRELAVWLPAGRFELAPETGHDLVGTPDTLVAAVRALAEAPRLRAVAA